MNLTELRGLLALLLLLVASPAPAAKLELEVGAGAGRSADGPTLSGRIGLDVLEHLTPSVRALTSGWGETSSQAWAVLGELRAHTSGRVQLTGGLGLGVGAAYVSSAPGEGVTARLLRTSPTLRADLGLRVTFSSLWVALGVAGSPSSPGLLGMLSVGWAPLKT